MSIGSKNNVGLINAPVTVEIPSELDLTLTVGQELDNLLQRALFVIDTTPSRLIREAGDEMVFLIKALEEAYKKNAEQTIGQIDHVLRDRINHIGLTIQQMEERNYPKLKELISEGFLQLGASTVFGSNYPFVRSFSPTCVAGSQMGLFEIDFFGIFRQAMDRAFQPTLTFNGHTATLRENNNTKLSFKMLASQAFGQNEVTTGILTIPYSQYVSINRGFVTYQFEVRKLPNLVGTITVETSTAETPPPKYEEKKSDLFKINSRKKYGGRDIRKICPLDVTPGRKMVYGSQKITWIKNSGKRNSRFEEVSERGVRFLAETWRNQNKDSHSGKLYFIIHFQEYAIPTPAQVPKEIPVELEWGGSKLVESIAKTWKVIFKPFDGSPAQEYSAPNVDHPYINILIEGNNLRFTTKEVDKLKNLQSARTLKITHTPQPPLAKTCNISSLKIPATFVAGFGLGYFVRSKL